MYECTVSISINAPPMPSGGSAGIKRASITVPYDDLEETTTAVVNLLVAAGWHPNSVRAHLEAAATEGAGLMQSTP